MSYANRPITDLLRGPLLHTPQGLAVLIVGAVYLVLLPFVYVDAISIFGKATGAGIVICLFWPFITFLYFLRAGISTTPDFKPSILEALWLLFIGMLPVLFPLKEKFFG